MGTIKINFNQKIGNIKPMHCVNNGPVWSDGVEQVRENFSFFKEAKIPYVRNHDAAFYALYGGEHTVDVHAIFPDFSRDVNDEDAYFHWTIIGVPDEPMEEDYESIADDENEWEDIVKYFATLIKDYDQIDV